MANNILWRNKKSAIAFCSKIHRALRKGAKKFTNLYIYGPKNCGKTFIVDPLGIIYKARRFALSHSANAWWARGVDGW